LPLSRKELSSDFGTRHRAAIGITEETDAVAIVISEERGAISLCFRGGIARDLEEDRLRSALEGLFGGGRPASVVAAEAEAAASISQAMAAMAGERPVGEESGVRATVSVREPTVPSKLSASAKETR
jgi:hypothetical protein